MDSRVIVGRRPAVEAEEDSESLGRRLRALRAELGITLAELGKMVDLSASYLSQIERNKAKPSLAALSSIAMTLGVELSYFFEHSSPVWQVVRKGRGEQLGDRRAKATFELLSSGRVGGKIEPYRVSCWPAMSIEPDTHQGEEFVFILKGHLEVSVGEEVFTLKAGDSIHYQGSQPHAWRNESGKECTLIWTLSPSALPPVGREGGG